MDRSALLASAARHLATMGVHLRERGETAEIEVADQLFQRRIYVSTAKDGVSALSEEDLWNTMVVAETLPKKLSERMRLGGTWFADDAGNAYISAPGILIDVRGRVRPSPVSRTPRTIPRNLFSAGRAQVIFVLLTWPHMLRRPVRELAERSGVSVAMAYHTLQLLEAQNHLRGHHLERRDELIDLWAGAYPLGLAKAIELGQFVGEPDPTLWAQGSRFVYLSGEAASDQLVGPDMTLYVPGLEPSLIAGSRWRRPKEGERANITLQRTFWREPEELRHRVVEREPVRRAPDLLVYADLLGSGSSRHQEAARELRGKL